MSDLDRAVKALIEKGAAQDRLWQYYDGEQPLVYSASRLRKIFERIDAHFSQNWCGVVVDSVLDRLSLTGFDVAEDKQTTGHLRDLMEETELELDDETVHQAALVCGEAFVICWREETGTEGYFNDARLCHAFYDPDHPRQMQFAAKWWKDADEKMRLTLYYPDRLEYYVSRGKAETVQRGDHFDPADPPRADNPHGVIPVVHFRKERRGIVSELSRSIRDQQDAVNKLLADMMVAAEFGAFKQRWVISNADTSKLKNAPNEVWDVPAAPTGEQPTAVGEFKETDLGGFLDAIDKLAAAMAIISRTPKHYFWAQGGDPSGEALIALEAPLNKKASRYIERFRVGWGRVGWLLLKMEGIDLPEKSVKAVFAEPETIQPKTRSDIRKTDVEAGIPLRTVLRREGWSEEDLAEMEADQKAEQEASANSLAAAVLRQQRSFDQGEQGHA